MINHEREVGEGTEAFEAAFIGIISEDWFIVHLLFHEGKATDLSGDGGDCFEGRSKTLADVASQFLGCSCSCSPSNVSPGSMLLRVVGKDISGSDGEGG